MAMESSVQENSPVTSDEGRKGGLVETQPANERRGQCSAAVEEDK